MSATLTLRAKAFSKRWMPLSTPPSNAVTLDPAAVLRGLTTGDPVSLGALPREHGIYALHNHTGSIRYIGITKADKQGFYGRINNRHVTGSESRSHKFSHAYNTGRMWRANKDERPDAHLAKNLRTAFIRRHCRATFLSLSPALWGELPHLEKAVQSLAPDGMFDWGDKRGFTSLPEPRELVDVLLDELSFTPEQREAVERQAALCVAN
jgi:hypothetical protein